MKDGVAIIGAGHGGSQLAVALRQEGYDGPIALFSNETEIPYHKPPLSKTFLKTPEASPQLLRAESVYVDNKVDLRFGQRVQSVDAAGRKLVLQDGSTASFERLVLATGARPRRLAAEGVEGDGVHYLRSAEDARTLRSALSVAQSVVVVGGGFIGLEAAASLAMMGKQVAVVEAAEQLLTRSVAPGISAFLADYHRSLGVRLLLGSGVDRLEREGAALRAVVTKAGERLDADLVIVGIGADADLDLARGAGCVVDNGVVVGPDLQSSVPGIYAIGDCAAYGHWLSGRAERLESVQNATDQARHAARSIVGRTGPYREVPWFWSDQGAIKLQMAGLSFGADRFVANGMPDQGSFSVYHFRGPRLVAVHSVNRPADHMLGRKLLATDMHVTDALIAGGAAAIKAALANHEAERQSLPAAAS